MAERFTRRGKDGRAAFCDVSPQGLARAAEQLARWEELLASLEAEYGARWRGNWKPCGARRREKSYRFREESGAASCSTARFSPFWPRVLAGRPPAGRRRRGSRNQEEKQTNPPGGRHLQGPAPGAYCHAAEPQGKWGGEERPEARALYFCAGAAEARLCSCSRSRWPTTFSMVKKQAAPPMKFEIGLRQKDAGGAQGRTGAAAAA